MTSICILCPDWHKKPSSMRISCSQVQTKKSAETLKWVSSLLRDNCAFTWFVVLQENENSSKTTNVECCFIESLKKDGGEWLFWVMNKAQWPFSFHWWNPSARICCFMPWERKLPYHTSSFGPEVLFLPLLCKITIFSVCLMTARGACSEQKKTSSLPESCLLWPVIHIRVSKFDFVYGEFPVSKPSQTFHCHYNALTITIHKSTADREIGIFYLDEKEP